MDLNTTHPDDLAVMDELCEPEAPAASGLEMKSLHERTQRTFDAFKAANDRRIEELRTRGAADPITVDQVDALNRELDALTHGGLENKAVGRRPIARHTPRAGGDDIKSAVVAIGKEVLRQGQVIDGRLRPGAGRAAPTSLAALEKRVAHAEVKANRPPGLAARWGGAGGARGVNAGAAARYKQAVIHWMRTGKEDEAISSLYRAAFGMKALHGELNPAGGYLLRPERRGGSPLEAAMAELSPMRRLATVHTLTEGDVFEIPTNVKGTSAGWVGEREARPETMTPELAMTSVPAMELYAMPSATQRWLDHVDSNIEAWLTNEVAEAFALQEGPAYITGDGNKKPRGLLTYPFVTDHDQWAHGSFRQVLTGVDGAFPAGALAGDKLIDMQYAVKSHYRPTASWLFSRTTAAVVRKMKDGDDKYLWQPGVTAGQPPTLLASAIEEEPNMPEIGSDSISLGYGDWARCYTIVEKGGVRVLRDPYSQKPFVLFYTTKLVGGGVAHFDSAVFLKFGD